MQANQVKAEMAKRMAAGDMDGALELIADDAVYFWSNGAAMFGREAIAEGLRANMGRIENDTFEEYDVVWLAESEQVAACVFAFRWTGTVDGREVGGHGRGASVLRRGEAGWQVVHENLSAGEWLTGRKTRRGTVP